MSWGRNSGILASREDWQVQMEDSALTKLSQLPLIAGNAYEFFVECVPPDGDPDTDVRKFVRMGIVSVLEAGLLYIYSDVEGKCLKILRGQRLEVRRGNTVPELPDGSIWYLPANNAGAESDESGVVSLSLFPATDVAPEIRTVSSKNPLSIHSDAVGMWKAYQGGGKNDVYYCVSRLTV